VLEISARVVLPPTEPSPERCDRKRCRRKRCGRRRCTRRRCRLKRYGRRRCTRRRCRRTEGSETNNTRSVRSASPTFGFLSGHPYARVPLLFCERAGSDRGSREHRNRRPRHARHDSHQAATPDTAKSDLTDNWTPNSLVIEPHCAVDGPCGCRDASCHYEAWGGPCAFQGSEPATFSAPLLRRNHARL
jgi:hypothetical protein